MIDFDRPYLIGSNGERVQADIRREQAEGCFRFSMQLPQAAQLREVVLFSGAHGFSPDAPFYGDGYQKLSQYRGTLAKFDSITGYTDRDHYKMPQTDGFSTVYNYALSRSFFADSSYMLSFSVLCSCVCSRLISPSVSSWHKQDNTLMHQSPGHIQRRTPYNF